MKDDRLGAGACTLALTCIPDQEAHGAPLSCRGRQPVISPADD